MIKTVSKHWNNATQSHEEHDGTNNNVDNLGRCTNRLLNSLATIKKTSKQEGCRNTCHRIAVGDKRNGQTVKAVVLKCCQRCDTVRSNTGNGQSTCKSAECTRNSHAERKVFLNVDAGKLCSVAVKTNSAHLITNLGAHKQPANKDSCDNSNKNTNVYIGTHNSVTNNRDITNCLSTVLGILHAIEQCGVARLVNRVRRS